MRQNLLVIEDFYLLVCSIFWDFDFLHLTTNCLQHLHWVWTIFKSSSVWIWKWMIYNKITVVARWDWWCRVFSDLKFPHSLLRIEQGQHELDKRNKTRSNAWTVRLTFSLSIFSKAFSSFSHNKKFLHGLQNHLLSIGFNTSDFNKQVFVRWYFLKSLPPLYFVLGKLLHTLTHMRRNTTKRSSFIFLIIKWSSM